MRFVRIVFVEAGAQKHCEACGTPKHGPYELYKYKDETGEIVVCFECRMYCHGDRTVSSFRQRQSPK